jgi:MFS family permease
MSVSLLEFMAKGYYLVNGLGRVFLGLLFDKFGFKKIFIVLLSVEVYHHIN